MFEKFRIILIAYIITNVAICSIIIFVLYKSLNYFGIL